MCFFRTLGLAVSLSYLTSYGICFAGAPSSPCKATTFSNNTFTQTADTFNVYEQVYLKIYCKDLSQGEHQISTEWVDNEGGLQRSDTHKFLLTKQQDYTCFFHFKLMPKGSLLRMISGKDFDDEQYGQWAVVTYIDNHQIGRKEFSYND